GRIAGIRAREHPHEAGRDPAALARVEQAVLRAELAIRARALRSDPAIADRAAARGPHGADGERGFRRLDPRAGQPVDLRLQHHAISLLRAGIRKSAQLRGHSDHLPRAAATARPRAVRRRADPGQVRDSAGRGADWINRMAKNVRIWTNAGAPALGTY